MFNLLVWLITVACFAVALRATYLIAFEKAWQARRDRGDNPESVPSSAPNLIAEPVNAFEPAPAGAELDAALQRNRDLVREIALLKDQLHASQTTTQSLRDRLDARTRREAERSEEENTRSAQFELATLRTAYQNGEAAEQRQEALRQIDEIEGEMAGLLSRQGLPGGGGVHEAPNHQADGDDRLTGVERDLATLAQTNKVINDENARLREEFAMLERRLQQQAFERQAVLESQQSLAEIVAKLQSLTDETIELHRSLKISTAEESTDGDGLPASAAVHLER